MEQTSATLRDLGGALVYAGKSVAEVFAAVTAAPMMAASGLDKGIKGLPLPGHEAHAGVWQESASGGQTYTASYGRTHRPPSSSAERQPFSREAPSRVTQAGEQAAGVLMPSRRTPAAQPSAGRPPSWSSPNSSGMDGKGVPQGSPSPRAPAPLMKQPSAKIAGGTLGLPRAGFTSAYRSTTVDSGAKGFYGHGKTGGMSVA